MSTASKTTSGPAVSSRAPATSEQPQNRGGARRLLDSLDAAGYAFHAGVPCSLLKGAIALLEERGDYVAAVREDVAVGMAAGAALAGRKAAVWMQNSGLGVSANALASLVQLYEIPMLLVVSWRGCGPDAPEHVLSGRITPDLLGLLGIPFIEADPGRLEGQVADADRGIARTGRPVALLVKKGVL